MRHSPLATLALAVVTLFPVTLSARSHPIKAIAAPARPPLHIIRPQHPQPSSFRPLAHGQGFSHRGGHAAEQIPEPRRDRLTRQSRREQHRLLAGTHRIARLPATSARHPQQQALAADSPRQPVSVVSLIRPTADKPQLPSVQQAAAEPLVLPSLYNERGRLIMPAPLFGSREILLRQNELADQDGLGRVQDDADLDAMRVRHILVSIPSGEGLRVDDRLSGNRRYCRPWTAQFLTALARAHYARFHTPLQVNSAVRTVAFQLRLVHTNGNAAPAEGDTASPHLTGQAVDIAKRGLSLAEIAWLRGYLLPLIQEGRVDVEEEFQQSCFHISVYRRYLPVDAAPLRYTASSAGTSVLATAVR